MAQLCLKYLCCRCCQYPGCCCCWLKKLKYNSVVADIVTCANLLPCMMCCRLPVESTVFLCGLNGAGKTALLYYFVLGKYFTPADPTKGFNNELCTFNKWQTYEFWDPGGSPVQRALWKKFYSRIKFDYVVYVIEAKRHAKLDPKKRESALDEDRMELHTLLNEEELKDAKFIVYVNFCTPPPEDEQNIDRQLVDDIQEDLELAEYAERVSVVGLAKRVKEQLNVKPDGDADLRGLCCP